MQTPDAPLRLGYSDAERKSSPYAAFFQPQMAPLPEHVREALAVGAVAQELLPPLNAAAQLQQPGYLPIETGYAVASDGAARVAVLTEMPGVTPAMWDWWFGWHGSEAQRYKLWHPQAHVDVAWQDGRDDLDGYIGRTSLVTEYVGSTLFNVRIRFVAPAEVGLDEARLKAEGQVAICARISMVVGGLHFETGWLLHQLRPVEGGAEMRSRFWIAGENVRPAGMSSFFGALIGRLAGWLQPVTQSQITELVVHDAQEMGHLAAILPALYQQFGPGQATPATEVAA